MSYILDLETLGHESTTIVLSAALLYVDFETEFTYQELVDRCIFVKFNVEEQKQKGRTFNQDTIDWWKQQEIHIVLKSAVPSPNDLSVKDGLKVLRDEYKKNKKDLVWARGSLDSMAIDSLAGAFEEEVVAPWWNYRDVRTAIDLLKETSKRSYCDIPGFDKATVQKHDPIHDVCYDAIQLRYGV